MEKAARPAYPRRSGAVKLAYSAIVTNERREARAQARLIHETRYPDAAAVLLAGSVVRGEATPHSDLDLVVLYERVPHAWRESFVSDGRPVEAFVHDVETLRYFFVEVDGRAGTPSLAAMVAEGIDVTAAGDRSGALTATAQQLAAEIIAAGPARWDERELRQRRYMLTDLVDDLRAPRSHAERVAAGARLYELLADCILRAAGRWSARGKSIPRVLGQHDAALAARFVAAFDALFAGDAGAVVTLVEDVLRPLGGFLFEGHRLDAPATWRATR